jgi:hypothetical protein
MKHFKPERYDRIMRIKVGKENGAVSKSDYVHKDDGYWHLAGDGEYDLILLDIVNGRKVYKYDTGRIRIVYRWKVKWVHYVKK